MTRGNTSDLFLRIILQIPFPLGAFAQPEPYCPVPDPELFGNLAKAHSSDRSPPPAPAPAPRAHGPQIAGLQARATLTLEYRRVTLKLRDVAFCPLVVYTRQTAGGYYLSGKIRLPSHTQGPARC